MSRPDEWQQTPAARPDDAVMRAAEERQAALTKPPGALGALETLAIRLAALQGRVCPRADRIHIAVFAGDHGVAEEGVSAFPQAVTMEMIRNFARGGAAVSVLARELGADLEIINLGTVADPGPLKGVRNLALGAGTANLAVQAAMTGEQLSAALQAGRDAAQRAIAAGAELFVGGEMGIANTTSATALSCVLLGISPEALAGPGTGLDAAGVAHKAEVVCRALQVHHGDLAEPGEALRRLGGFEIAALAGAYMACAQTGLPVLVDGFISSVAALAATRMLEGADQWFFFAHASAEPGHRLVLDALDAQPLLGLGMRLGEGSGAATAVPLLRVACALHGGMATFEEAGVSEKAAS